MTDARQRSPQASADTAETVVPDVPGAIVPPSPDTAAHRYVLGEEIAHGGLGIIYRATDTVLGREVAVKVMHDKHTPDSNVALRFIDEAHITAQLQHPAIPPVHDLGTLPDGRPFLAMKFIKGQTLADLLAARLDPSADRGRFVAVFEQVCQAVAYAHAHGVIHRDLKPANVMVGAFGEVQLMDWGLAKVLSGRERPQPPSDPQATRPDTEVISLRDCYTGFTQAGSVLGTPAFMPPEQAAGVIEMVDQRSDVFGLGAVLAVILTGKPPFAASSAESTRGLAALGDVADCFARLDACGADPELVALSKRCLCPRQAGRPADANEVAKAVAQLRAAADERARQAELDRVKAEGEKAAAELRTAEQRKRRWIQAALGMSFTALVVLAGTFAWWQDRQKVERQAEQEARQARTAAGVAATIREARKRLQEAWELTDYPPRMQAATDAAMAALGRANRLAVDGDATPETAAELAAARAEVEDLARHTRLITDASRTLQQAGDRGFTVNEIPARLQAALRHFGFDPCNDPEADVVRLVIASRIRDSLLAVLLEMEFNITKFKPIPMGNLLKVIQAVRRHLGGPYARWQELLDRRDFPGLVAFARTPEALSLRAGVINALGRDLSGEGVTLKEDERAALEARKAQGHDLAGEGTMATGNPQACRDLLRAAVARYPHDVWLHFDLILVCQEMKPPANAEALRHAAATVLLLPESPGMHNVLAKAYANLGDLDRARDTFRKAIQLDPERASTHAALAEVLEEKGDPKEAIAAWREAIRLGPTAFRHYRLGNLLRREGRLDEAEQSYRESVRLDGNRHGPAIDALADLLLSRGNLDKAAAAYQEILRIDPDNTAAPANLSRVRRMRDLLPRLPDVLAGKDEPRSPAEACEFAQLCKQPFQKRYADAVGLYTGAFAADPKLAQNLKASHRYDAACCAALAAAGPGEDAAKLDDKKRARWREQALDWLRADLTAYGKLLDGGKLEDRALVRQRLKHWQRDADLAGIRDAKELARLPADERQACAKLWADVLALLGRKRVGKGVGTRSSCRGDDEFDVHLYRDQLPPRPP